MCSAGMLWVMLLCLLSKVEARSETILTVGGLIEDENEEIALHVASSMLNTKYKTLPFRLVPAVSKVNCYKTFEVLSSACMLLKTGIIGMFGPSSPHSSPYMQAILDKKEIPHIENHWDAKLVRNSCLLNVHPHPSVISNVLVDLVLAWKWKKLIFIYENDEGFSKIDLLLTLHDEQGPKITIQRLQAEIPGDTNFRPMLSNLKKSGDTNFVLDCSIENLEIVLKQAQQVGLMTEKYNYIITNLDLQTINLEPFQYAGTNITGIRIINPEDAFVINVAENIRNVRAERGRAISVYPSVVEAWKMRVKTGLIYDAVHLFYEAVMDLTTSGKIMLNTKTIHCNSTDNWKYGHTIINYMKGKSVKGLTGVVKFDTEGFRSDFTLDIIELAPGGLSKIGEWNSKKGLNITRLYTHAEAIFEEGSLANKTFRVITCLTTPYGMLKENTDQLIGNDRYEGFGIDLIDELSKVLGFNYTILIQEDGANGNFDNKTMQWNGLIGQVVRDVGVILRALLLFKIGAKCCDIIADLAIGDLTVTAEREAAVDFTSEFMNLGIQILYRKPEPMPPSLFMFASPFSVSVWAMLGVSYLLVSLSFFAMGRLSPSEWTNPYPCIEEPEYLINQFSFRNSFWFTIGCLLQQGSEVAPIGLSTRTAAVVWLFFTLILVSTYTANLAAFLTVETLVTPFGNVEELSQQKKIKYGAKANGATASFFREFGNDSVRERIWQFMASHTELMTSDNEAGVKRVEDEDYAFFMESTTIEYVVERHCTLASVGNLLDEKGYAIALKKNSSYRNDLSTAILKLQETGKITSLKTKWWKEKRGAGMCAVKEPVATPLDLKNVGGVFLVLFVGSLIGFLATFLELGATLYRRTKGNKEKFKEEFINEWKFFLKFKQNVKNVNPNDDTSENSLL